MNLNLILDIAQLALSLVTNTVNSGQSATSVTSALLQILQKGAQAYQQHTGQALDPSLIHAEAAV